MAFIQNFSFPSKYLDTEPQVAVALPSRHQAASDKEIWQLDGKFKTLYLLHGAGDNQSVWSRLTNIEWYCEQYNVAVVMPFGAMSFYTDMLHGQRYWSYLSEELPRYMQAIFPLSDKREDNFVAGNSMGGYGAFKLALSCPERFCAAASLSGALNMSAEIKNVETKSAASPNPTRIMNTIQNVFGGIEGFRDTPNDLFWLIRRNLREGRPMPRLYQCVGTEDFLYEYNQDFRRFTEENGVAVTYAEQPGRHDWDYWQERLPDVFAWLFPEGDARQ